MPPAVGMCFDRTFPPGEVVAFARRLEDGGVDELWVIEDCFHTTATPLAAAALSSTERLVVGIGILPAPVRTAAVTAMELATLARLAPGRLIAGVGHGVQDWMGQMGVRPASPLTALEEVLVAVRRLLAGDTVTVEGRHVTLDDVALDPPPGTVPPVLAGVRGPRSLAVAGRSADGLVLAEWIGPRYVRQAIAAAGAPDGFDVATYSVLSVAEDPRAARSRVVEQVATQLREGTPNVAAHPHVDELRERLDDGGTAALVDAPAAWWGDLGAIGTIDDAVAHVEAMHEAGAEHVALFPAADLDVARGQVDEVVRIAAAVG